MVGLLFRQVPIYIYIYIYIYTHPHRAVGARVFHHLGTNFVHTSKLKIAYHLLFFKMIRQLVYPLSHYLTESWLSGELYAATWQGQVMRAYRVPGVGERAQQMGSYLSEQVVQGQAALDSSAELLYAIVADPLEPSADRQLLALMPRTGQEVSRTRINVSDAVLWNLEVDEADATLVAVSVSPKGSFLVRLDILNGTTSRYTQLNSGVRFGLSAMDQPRRVYYFIEPDTGVLRGYGLANGALQAPVTLTSANQQVYAIGFDSKSRLLQALVGEWPPKDSSEVYMVVYDTATSVVRTPENTTLRGAHVRFSGFAWDFVGQRCFISSSDGTITVFNISSGSSYVHSNSDSELSNVFALLVLQDRTPVARGIVPSTLRAVGSPQFTITGRHFGMRDFSPHLDLDIRECESVKWVSDRQIVCTLPSLHPDNSGKTLDVNIRVRGWSKAYDKLVSLDESWYTIAPNSTTTLTADKRVAILGYGFREPFAAYRAVFSSVSGDMLATSGSPVVWSIDKLEFDAPVWLQNAGLTTVHLLHGSNAGDYYNSPVPNSLEKPVYFMFNDAWTLAVRDGESPREALLGRGKPLELYAYGGMTLSMAGLGFDITGAAGYQCVFQGYNSVQEVTQALVISGRQMQCVVPNWLHAAGAATLFVRRTDTMGYIARVFNAKVVQSSGQDFEFLQGWRKLAPESGPFTGGTVVSFEGFGFDETANYTCSFTLGATVLVPAQVVNSTMITCNTSLLPQDWVLRGKALVQLNRTGGYCNCSRPVEKHGGPGWFDFKPVWDVLAPTSAPAQGGVRVTVTGYGLRNDNSTYRCVFKSDTLTVQTPFFDIGAGLSTNGSSSLVCVTPVWPSPATVLPLQVNHAETHTTACRKTPYLFIYTYVCRVYMHICLFVCMFWFSNRFPVVNCYKKR
jgi:hypothetical protein